LPWYPPPVLGAGAEGVVLGALGVLVSSAMLPDPFKWFGEVMLRDCVESHGHLEADPRGCGYLVSRLCRTYTT
jgi:hypothetical protein